MFTFITKYTQKILLEIGRGQVYIYNLFIFSPYRYSSSTQLTRHKIHSDNTQNPKNHSTHLFGQNLTIPYQTNRQTRPKNHNKISYLHITPTQLPHLTQTLINSTQINKISPKNTTPTQHFHIKHHFKYKPQQNSAQTPNNDKYT